jgi:uncharacterized membrane protein YgdD (TMEM256/DUF423 family)
MRKTVLLWASILGIIAISLGAFGAHGLKKALSPASLEVFQTGVDYQMYHALFLLFVGVQAVLSEKQTRFILTTTLLGILFFSGSLYLLATNSLTAFDFKILGPITPVGGLLLIISWGSLGYGILKKTPKKLQ